MSGWFCCLLYMTVLGRCKILPNQDMNVYRHKQSFMFKNSGSLTQFYILVMARKKNPKKQNGRKYNHFQLFRVSQPSRQDNWWAYQATPEMPTSFLRSRHCSKPKTKSNEQVGHVLREDTMNIYQKGEDKNPSLSKSAPFNPLLALPDL